MKEKVTAVTDEGMVSYSRVLKNALELEKDIKKRMEKGEKTVYLTIYEETASRSIDPEIGRDLLKIAQGAAFGAYYELVYVWIPVKKTGEQVREINPDGKAIANGIIREVSMQNTPTEGVIETFTVFQAPSPYQAD